MKRKEEIVKKKDRNENSYTSLVYRYTFIYTYIVKCTRSYKTRELSKT